MSKLDRFFPWFWLLQIVICISDLAQFFNQMHLGLAVRCTGFAHPPGWYQANQQHREVLSSDFLLLCSGKSHCSFCVKL